jgi:hypothetical protein
METGMDDVVGGGGGAESLSGAIYGWKEDCGGCLGGGIS